MSFKGWNCIFLSCVKCCHNSLWSNLNFVWVKKSENMQTNTVVNLDNRVKPLQFIENMFVPLPVIPVHFLFWRDRRVFTSSPLTLVYQDLFFFSPNRHFTVQLLTAGISTEAAQTTLHPTTSELLACHIYQAKKVSGQVHPLKFIFLPVQLQ